MNEGHAALLTVELYRRFAAAPEPVEEVRARAVFTTHTPVAAGHDVFDRELAERLLGADFVPTAIADLAFEDNHLNMTRLALNLSRYHNGVAKKHGEVSRELFPGYNIASITNGVHAQTWVAAPLAKLYDRYFPDWRADPFSLRYAFSIPQDELWNAHQEAKRTLVSYLKERHGVEMSEDKFTIGFARRGASYKRGNLLFTDIERLARIAGNSKGIQIIYGGKAHRFDHQGKLMLQEIIHNMRRIGHNITATYIENYDIETAKLMVAGVDLWLNTPVRPQEASGTSGMKAALNGVPQFSIQD
jgi:starch phosphorylase